MSKTVFVFLTIAVIGLGGCAPAPKWQLIGRDGPVMRMHSSTGVVEVMHPRTGEWLPYAEGLKLYR